MKRLATTALAVSALTVSLAMANDRHDNHRSRDRATGSSQHHDSRDRDHRRNDNDRHYRDDRRHDWRGDNRNWRDDRRNNYERRNNYHRDYRYSQGYRNDYRRSGYRVPRGYFGRPYVVANYGYYRLRPPPRGCHWVRMDHDLVLAALATGIVLDVMYDYF
jgi:Ni/Co efflux regulator RcnB